METFINILFILLFQSGATQVAGLNGTTAAFQAPARVQAESLGLSVSNRSLNSHSR